MANGQIPPEYEDITDINFAGEGEIAGSRLTLNIACRNMMKHTGASIVDVFQYASYNPAQAVGLNDCNFKRRYCRMKDIIFAPPSKFDFKCGDYV